MPINNTALASCTYLANPEQCEFATKIAVTCRWLKEITNCLNYFKCIYLCICFILKVSLRSEFKS